MSGPVGVGVPMGVVEPREKELPREPGSAAMGGRSRSGTGRSSKDKKSMFGFVSGTSLSLFPEAFSQERRWSADERGRFTRQGQAASDFETV